MADVCKKPFAATHSNCMALSPHQRNLTDEQLQILGNTGSVVGNVKNRIRRSISTCFLIDMERFTAFNEVYARC